MPCLTLKSGTIIMVDNPESFSEALGEEERKELLRRLETIRPELKLAKPVGNRVG